MYIESHDAEVLTASYDLELAGDGPARAVCLRRLARALARRAAHVQFIDRRAAREREAQRLADIELCRRDMALQHVGRRLEAWAAGQVHLPGIEP